MMFSYDDYPRVDKNGMRFYKIDDTTLYPSITTILGITVSDEKKDRLEAWKQRLGEEKAKAFSKAAAARGTIIHKMAETYIQSKTIDGTGASPVEMKMFHSIKNELNKISGVYGLEVPLVSHLLKVAGTVDLVGIYDGKPAVIDYKTSYREKGEAEIEDYFLQATFYALAHNEMHHTEIEKIVIILGVENKLPLIYRRDITVDLVGKLIARIEKFYEKLP